MAAKRSLEDLDNISDKEEGLPSVTVVMRKSMTVDFIQYVYALRPCFGRMVREDLEQGIHRRARLWQRSPQMLIEEPKSSFAQQLIFKKPPPLDIFTENIIKDGDGNSLQILLTEIATGEKPKTTFPSSIKLEIVVLDGDFSIDDSENWSSSEFDGHVVKERKGKGPLLTGTTVVKLNDGAASFDELKFTDNSSWTRTKNFRIGVRVSSENRQSLNIREAVSSPIVVKDRRGEAYMKHDPPLLSDEVWRLNNIAKGGARHKKLVEMNIYTVKDFLKLSVIDSQQLRKTLKMSDKSWEATIKRARSCSLGDMPYIQNDPPFYNDLNPICDVPNILVNGALKTHQEVSMPTRATVQETALQTFNSWDRLEGISFTTHVETQYNELFNDGELMPNNELMGVEIWSQEDVQEFPYGRPDKQTRGG